MHDAPGIGLAAPQVGVTKRLIVMDCMKAPDAPRPLILFNPEVTWRSSELSTYEEGCLSIPDQYADVERPNRATVRWMDETGAPQEETFDGLWAICAPESTSARRSASSIQMACASTLRRCSRPAATCAGTSDGGRRNSIGISTRISGHV